jgi:glycosyltransferase involved in cell wall biosynthesis
LLSLISQNYPNFEIIAVDDNSTDRTLSIMKSIESTSCGRVKVVQLRDKPEGWTGKTWASQQGYLKSRGDILLFTDADTYYKNNDAIALAVMRMIQDKLDVLTGVPYLALPDTWSRIVMPVWNLYSEIFGRGIADVNNPKCKAAFVMGSFFMIRRHVFEEIGTYHNVKHEIQEDKAIGIILKRNHYKMKIFKIDEIVSALWSRDLITLWHGIRRTLVPMVIENRSSAALLVQQALLFFFMIILPFALLPLIIIIHLPTQPLSLLYINIFLCLLIVITTAVKGFSKYGLPPYYSIVSVIGASFLIVAYAYSIIPFLMRYNTQPISWRGRMHDPLVDCSGKRSLQEAQ